MQHILPRQKETAGFSLLEMILSLFLLSVTVMLVTPLYRTLISLKNYDSYLYQDEIGIYQLQIALALSKDIEVDEDHITFHNVNGEFELSLVNRKLIAQPGTLDYIHDISSLSFESRDGVIYLIFYRRESRFEYPIGYYAK